MKRIKIFLRLKCREVRDGILPVCGYASIFILLVGGYTALIWVFLTFPIVVFIAAFIVVTVPACWLGVATKRWLVSNWKEAGRLAKEDTP